MKQKVSKNLKKIHFCPAEFTETTEELVNPCRGWYQIHTFKLGDALNFSERKYTLENNDALAFVLIDISRYRRNPLDEKALKDLHDIFMFFKMYGLEMIVRVVYDTVGQCLDNEPDSEDMILEHISQLVGVMEEFKDIIFVYQGLLIGNWGEMHSSKYLSPARLKKLSERLLSDINDTAYLAVRRPAYVRILFPEGEDTKQKTVGLFDDAIMGSETHLGTFGNKAKAQVKREQSWLPAEEIDYVSTLCDRVPYGGEALWNDEKDALYKIRHSLSETVNYCSKLHLTYLNRIHDVRFIDNLKKLVWPSGIYKDFNGYDYFSCHLGYRFVLRNVTCEMLPDPVEALMMWKISIENVGFARAYFDNDAFLEVFDQQGNKTSFDISKWIVLNMIESNGTHTFNVVTPPISGFVFLRFCKADNKQTVFFANASVFEKIKDEKIYVGCIDCDVKERAADEQ